MQQTSNQHNGVQDNTVRMREGLEKMRASTNCGSRTQMFQKRAIDSLREQPFGNGFNSMDYSILVDLLDKVYHWACADLGKTPDVYGAVSQSAAENLLALFKRGNGHSFPTFLALASAFEVCNGMNPPSDKGVKFVTLVVDKRETVQKLKADFKRCVRSCSVARTTVKPSGDGITKKNLDDAIASFHGIYTPEVPQGMDFDFVQDQMQNSGFCTMVLEAQREMDSMYASLPWDFLEEARKEHKIQTRRIPPFGCSADTAAQYFIDDTVERVKAEYAGLDKLLRLIHIVEDHMLRAMTGIYTSLEGAVELPKDFFIKANANETEKVLKLFNNNGLLGDLVFIAKELPDFDKKSELDQFFISQLKDLAGATRRSIELHKEEASGGPAMTINTANLVKQQQNGAVPKASKPRVRKPAAKTSKAR